MIVSVCLLLAGASTRAGIRRTIQWSNPWRSNSAAWRRVIFLNGDQCEEKKRDPRLREEEERAAASLGTGPHEAPAASATSSAAGESGEAACHLDEIGTPRVVTGSPTIVIAWAWIVVGSLRQERFA